VEGNGGGLFEVTIPEIAWKEWNLNNGSCPGQVTFKCESEARPPGSICSVNYWLYVMRVSRSCCCLHPCQHTSGTPQTVSVTAAHCSGPLEATSECYAVLVDVTGQSGSYFLKMRRQFLGKSRILCCHSGGYEEFCAVACFNP
jgi:hypothetical protein